MGLPRRHFKPVPGTAGGPDLRQRKCAPGRPAPREARAGAGRQARPGLRPGRAMPAALAAPRAPAPRISRVDIHQMQVRYDARADRLLWQVRSADGALFAVWLTRRLVRALWPPYQALLTQATIRQTVPQAGPASLVPEAQAMLAEQALSRPLPGADFEQPFNADAQAQPLGAEPLLPEAIDFGPSAGPAPGVRLRVREPGGRSFSLDLHADLAAALARLILQAVAASDWDLALGPAAAPASAAPPGRLN